MAVQVKGTVARLFVNAAGANLRLHIPTDQQPKDGYFLLELTHQNYLALYSLALAAAMNRDPLLIRTAGEITEDTRATVQYMVVDW